MFEKLYKYVGKAIKTLVDRGDEPYCFRLHKNRVFYVRESVMRRATNVSDGALWAPQAARGLHMHVLITCMTRCPPPSKACMLA